MNTPGKYDGICTMARIISEGRGVLLIVLDGKHGSGFSAQVPPKDAKDIPNILRNVADMIEASPSEPIPPPQFRSR